MAKRVSIGTVLLGAATIVCAGAALYWWLGVDRTEVYTDGGLVAAPADSATPRDVLWRPPEGLGALNGALAEGTPRVAPGGDEVWFSRTAGDTGSDLFLARREGDSWGEPGPARALNTVDNESGAVVSGDGAWVYFASDRPGGAGGTDLWRAPRAPGGWGDPEPVPGVNTAGNELDPAPFVGVDGEPGLFFASDRVAEGAEGEGSYDLYRVTFDPGSPAVPERVDALSSAGHDVGIAVSPSGDFVYFSSDRAGGVGGFDLYRARVTDEGFGSVENLGVPINTTANELEPGLAMGGFALLYASDRAGGRGGTDLYRSVSREVYLASGTRFAGLWGDLLALLPWILAALALVLLLALLRRLHAGGAWEGKLSTLGLMARCVLLSLILHALLMALLSLWQVELAPGMTDGQDKGTRVALTSGAGAEALGAQVRGGFTEAEVARAEAEAASAPEAAFEPERAPGSAELAARRDADAGSEAMRVAAAAGEMVARERAGMEWAQRVAEVVPDGSEAALGVPDAGRRGVRAEGVRPTPRGSAALAGGSGPRAATDARDAPTRALDPGTIGDGYDGAADGLAVGVSASETAAQERAGMAWADRVADVAPDGSPAALSMPEQGRRGVRAEEMRGTPRGSAGVDEGVGVDAALAGSASTPARELGAGPVGGALGQPGGGIGVDVAHGEAQAADAMLGVPVADTTIEPGAGAADVATPDTGARAVARESGDAIERARGAVGAARAPSAAGRAGSAGRADVAPDLDDPPGDEAMGFQTQIAESAPGEDARAVFGSEPPDLGGLGEGPGLGEIGLPAGRGAPRAEAGAEPGARVARVRAASASLDGTGMRAPPAGMHRGDVDPAWARGAQEDAMAFEAPTRDAGAAAEESLDAFGAPELTLELPDDGLGGIAVPDAGGTREEARVVARAEPEPERARAETAAGGAPDIRGSGADAAAELAVRTSVALDEELDVTARAARDADLEIGADAAGPVLGMPELDDLAPMEMAAVSIPLVDTRLRMSGRVVDAETGEPIPGALVRVDLIDEPDAEVVTDAAGSFELGFEDAPDHVALAASAEGYVPGALNIAEDDLEDGAYAEIRLDPFNPYEIAMEDEPRVHHLGNDEYTGRINSQFQRESEGREIRFEFTLGPAQLPPNVAQAELVLLAKGVQLDNPVGVNGRRLQTTLRESPADGSFGEQRIWIPLELLREGENWVAIRSVREPGTDIDDFEFVNVRVMLRPAPGGGSM